MEFIKELGRAFKELCEAMLQATTRAEIEEAVRVYEETRARLKSLHGEDFNALPPAS